MALFTSVLAAIAVLVPLQGATEIEFVTTQLPWAAVNKGYSPSPFEVRTSGTCPLNGIGYSIVAGELPPGVQLSRLGYFSGIPSRTGLFAFNVRAANGCSFTGKTFAIRVADPPVLEVRPSRLEFHRIAGAGGQSDGDGAEQTPRVSASWPGMSYLVEISVPPLPAGGAPEDSWLSAVPELGMTPREVTSTALPLNVAPSGTSPIEASAAAHSSPAAQTAEPEDRLRVRVDASHLKPGHYTATITLSAWQAAAAAILVDLIVEEPAAMAK